MNTLNLLKKDWTHTEVKITDIRKLTEYYIFTINTLPDKPLLVKDKIFEERLKPYFLKEAHRVTREEIMGVNWNMYISQGHYVKIVKGEFQQYPMDANKYYVSYLEIAGPLGSFQSVYKEHQNQ